MDVDPTLLEAVRQELARRRLSGGSAWRCRRALQLVAPVVGAVLLVPMLGELFRHTLEPANVFPRWSWVPC